MVAELANLLSRVPAPLAQIGDMASQLSAPQALGSEAHLVAGVGLFAGLVLWLFGSRVLRSMFALLGAAVGAFTGLVLLPLSGMAPFETGWTAMPSVSAEQIGLVGGAVLGVVLAVTLYRAVMALGSGFVFASVGLLAGLIYVHGMPETAGADGTGVTAVGEASALDLSGLDSIDTSALQEATDWLSVGAASADDQARPTFDESGRLDIKAARAQLAGAADRSSAFLSKLSEALRERWAALGARQRLVLLGSSIVGLTAGLLFGMTMPSRSAALMTAMAGSGIAMGCGLMLAESYDLPRTWLLSQPASTWAIMWGVAAAIGLTFQMTVAKRGRGGSDDDGDDDD